ncbi:helix-turn-helix domain-containing protein [Sphaerisporangium perillae]|uniref:helix-turn-helix domain-containing protein n=1 Tax=Sphaerisporangium perillae TaxID=2935860 RepID=UPI00200E4163|nr:helix-turn-helix domain-containing protein [Sphaerisporangium perillae]
MSLPDYAKRIAAVRAGRRMSQAQLATAANISISLLRKIEQGSRRASPEVLAAIAHALDVDPAHLSGTSALTDSQVHAAIPDIRRAIALFDLPADGPSRSLAELEAAVGRAIAWRLGAQYIQLARVIPGLMQDLARALHTQVVGDRERIATLLALACRAADGVAFKYGYLDLSARAIELMRWAADQSGDETVAATAAYVRTEIFFADNHLEPALRVLDQAAARLRPARSEEAAAAYGALHMRAAVVAGRAGMRETAWDHLREAGKVALMVREGVYNGTAFGTSSVRIHEVSVSTELGDGERAIRTVGAWAPPDDLPRERRSHYYIDLARAQLWTGRRDDAFASLQFARRIAPQHTREHRHVREMLTTMLRLQRASRESLLAFAAWARVT